jgi:heme exporter protein C
MKKLAKVALLLLLCATTVGGFVWLPPAKGFANEGLARIVVFHVPCSIVAYLATAVAAWYAARYLWKRAVPDDIKSRTSFALALLFWALTTVTGAIFAKVQWGTYWNWDIKQGAILILLMINIAYFALRAAIDDSRKQATLGAAYAIFALLAAPYLTYILPNSTPDTLHPKGVITSRGGLSAEYALVLWAGVFGLSMVYLWAFRLQVTLEMIQWRLERRGRKRRSRTRPSMTVG